MGAGGNSTRAVLVVSVRTDNTASDKDPIPALTRFNGAIIHQVRTDLKTGRMPPNVVIWLFDPTLGFIRHDMPIGPVNPDKPPLATYELQRQLNSVLQNCAAVCLALVDKDWRLLSSASGLKRSTLTVTRARGYVTAKIRRIRVWYKQL